MYVIASLTSSVLYLYEFTLLSNQILVANVLRFVLYLYEFTLLSNITILLLFGTKFYTSMNLHYSQTKYGICKCN